MSIAKLLLLAMAASFALTGCDNDYGMAEKAGAAMDEAGDRIEEIATDAGNAVEDACEDVKKNVDAKDIDC